VLDSIRLLGSAEKASAVLKAMANKRRLLILCQLVQGEKSVGELEELINLNQSALSQHLAILRRNNLVQTRREAQTIYYSLSTTEAEVIMQALYDLYCRDAAASDAARKKGRSKRARRGTASTAASSEDGATATTGGKHDSQE